MRPNKKNRYYDRKKPVPHGPAKAMEKALYMGIDWGRNDVGVSLATEPARIAYAYITLFNDDSLLSKLGSIILQKGVKTVVLGIPSPINREEVLYVSERLGEVLEQNFGVVVEYQNEMFTTKMAQAYLVEKGVRRIERFDDQEAARVILQDWLDRKTIEKTNTP